MLLANRRRSALEQVSRRLPCSHADRYRRSPPIRSAIDSASSGSPRSGSSRSGRMSIDRAGPWRRSRRRVQREARSRRGERSLPPQSQGLSTSSCPPGALQPGIPHPIAGRARPSKTTSRLLDLRSRVVTAPVDEHRNAAADADALRDRRRRELQSDVPRRFPPDAGASPAHGSHHRRQPPTCEASLTILTP